MHAADPTSPLALIVNDDPAFRISSHVSLEEDGLRLEEVASGQAAVDFAAACMPDIVILDIQMPGWTGSPHANAFVNCLAEMWSPFLS